MRIVGEVKDKIKKYYIDKGLVKSCIYVLTRVIKRISRQIYYPFEYRIAVFKLAHVDCNNELSSDITIKVISNNDNESIIKQFGDDIANVFKKRLKHSNGYIAYYEDIIVGYAWTSSQYLMNEGIKPFLMNLKPLDGNIYIYDCFTNDKYRNKKIFSKLLLYLLSDSNKSNYNLAFLIFRHDNLPMAAVMKKMKFEIVGEVHCCRIMFYKYIDANDLKRYCVIS